MALVTQANIDSVTTLQKKIGDVSRKLSKLQTLLLRVYGDIEQDSDPNLNDGRDWDELVTKYLPSYDTAITELKALAEALDRWPT